MQDISNWLQYLQHNTSVVVLVLAWLLIMAGFLTVPHKIHSIHDEIVTTRKCVNQTPK
jgi:hypothetical protein